MVYDLWQKSIVVKKDYAVQWVNFSMDNNASIPIPLHKSCLITGKDIVRCADFPVQLPVSVIKPFFYELLRQHISSPVAQATS